MNRKVEVSQLEETEVQAVIRGIWEYQYGYSRAYECRQAGDPGQDYLTFFERNGSLLFAVCDGISMSYFGDWAAKFLGDRLIDWLSMIDTGCKGEADIQQSLDCYLRKIAVKARESLDRHQIPAHIHGMLREVIAAKKQKGSGAVYGCGRIDVPSRDYPKGRMILAWQGDIRIRIWMGDTEETARLGNHFHTRHQWNSASGPIGGLPYIFAQDLGNGGGKGAVLLYSDGLKSLDRLNSITEEQISQLWRREAADVSGDDMSMFHVKWDFTLSDREND